VSRLLRARIVSLGLVAALGFLLIVSLIASAAITALGDLLNAYLPFGEMLLSAINAVVSFVLIAILFGAIYKILPDRSLKWRDVRMGAVVTAALGTKRAGARSWLFTPPMAGALRDPSFPAVAERLGLMKYWRTTHTRPDACSVKGPPPFCRML